MRAAHDAVGGVAAGLVSLSTTRPLPVPIFWAENVVTIDREQQRVTNLRKSLGVAAKVMPRGHSDRLCMVTLTYAGDNSDWKPMHIANYLNSVRKWLKRTTGDKLRYVWVAELQERGVIHYHCVFWLPKGVTMPKADKRGWWPYGMTRTEQVKQPVAYLMSYVSKIESKNVGEFPHGARISGVGGLDKSGRDIRRWVRWPSYLRQNAEVGECWKAAKGGGFINHDDGRYLRSEYAPTGGGFRSFIRVHTHERAIDAAGPFNWIH